LFFTSAGIQNMDSVFRKRYLVVHVVSSTLFALKAQNAERYSRRRFEAGGHNGRDETTTFTLIQW
jgi:enoyl-[acyl-carrier protein] reductase II